MDSDLLIRYGESKSSESCIGFYAGGFVVPGYIAGVKGALRIDFLDGKSQLRASVSLTAGFISQRQEYLSALGLKLQLFTLLT